jgi:uncharacterized protein
MGRPVSAAGTDSFDAFRLVREQGVISGRLDAVTLPRVADELIEDSAPVEWRIEGTADAAGRPALAVQLDGVLPLECQRCLEVVHWPVSQRTELLLAHNDAEMARLDADSELEVVLATGPLDPVVLIEDELVLAIPFAPRHAECPTPDEDASASKN